MMHKLNSETNLLDLARQVYLGNKEKGFWDAPRLNMQIINLVMSEMFELYEAVRKGVPSWRDLDQSDRDKMLVYCERLGYKNVIKDKFLEEELADIVIRVLDYLGFYAENYAAQFIDEAYFTRAPNTLGPWLAEHAENGHQYKSIDVAVYDAMVYLDSYSDEHLLESLTGLIYHVLPLFPPEKHDLILHIELKLNYNKTREHKHGKQF